MRETLYQHCTHSLQRALDQLCERGLTLMETGDWNDGMNRVGKGGKGESVWLRLINPIHHGDLHSCGLVGIQVALSLPRHRVPNPGTARWATHRTTAAGRGWR